MTRIHPAFNGVEIKHACRWIRLGEPTPKQFLEASPELLFGKMQATSDLLGRDVARLYDVADRILLNQALLHHCCNGKQKLPK
jgi:hypothetical protein